MVFVVVELAFYAARMTRGCWNRRYRRPEVADDGGDAGGG